MTVLLVAAGGVLGVLARYGIGTAVPNGSLPTATLAINVVGSGLLGFLVAAGQDLPAEVRTGIAVGFLGGFTTYSTFAVDAFLDLEGGRAGQALVYVAASVVLGIGAAAAGYWIGRAVG